jgi:hypothetical protein
VIASPVAKKIADVLILPKFLDEGRYVLFKECINKGSKFFLTLEHGCLGSAK